MKNRIREFRAWNGEEFVFDFTITTEGECLYSGDVKKWVVTEFFGLYDKYGKKLYEGDINEKGHFLKFNLLHNCFGWFGLNGYKEDILSDYIDNNGKFTYLHSQYKKIGNIFQNEELIL